MHMEIMRDYGAIGGTGFPGPSTYNGPMSQVYQATHKGSDRTDYMYRSFISFIFGDKHIEDFNLIATFGDSGLNQTGYADFEDLTTENDVVPGQMFWGTHIQARKLSFQLSTDGISQRQLDDFLAWFSPGQTRTLILAEHPNREAYARVAAAPELELTPFEEQIEVKLGEEIYKTSTTLYKGSINLELVMDEPFWHSKVNIFGHVDEEDSKIYHDEWTDANGRPVNVYESKDALKIAYEDGIPLSNMIKDTMILGNNVIADMNTDTGAITMPEYPGDTGYYENIDDTYDENAEYTDQTTPTEAQYWRYRIAEINELTGKFIRGARIAGPYITSSKAEIISLAPATALNNNVEYFYYAGNAKSYPIISFILKPRLNNNYYIENINSKFNTSDKTYNTITIESVHKNDFKFTTPGLYTAYNQTISIFSNLPETPVWEEVRAKIRDEVKHSKVRAWANIVIDYADAKSDMSNMLQHMSYLLLDENGDGLPVTFTFDSRNGEATGMFDIREAISPPEQEENWATHGVIDTYTENVGDMIKSPYLYIIDRNYPDADGNIRHWTDSNKQNSHTFSHDIDDTITEVSIEYKNMYW